MFKKSQDNEGKPTQSINIGGGTFTNAQIAQAGGDLQQSQQIMQGEINEGLTVDEVVGLFEQLTKIVHNTKMADDQKEKVLRHIDSSKEEVQEKEPDKDFVKKNLQKATKVLKEADEAVSAGQGLWQKLEPIVTKLAGWLGVAVNVFWS